MLNPSKENLLQNAIADPRILDLQNKLSAMEVCQKIFVPRTQDRITADSIEALVSPQAVEAFQKSTL